MRNDVASNLKSLTRPDHLEHDDTLEVRGLEAPPLRLPGRRGVHSSTFQRDVSNFCGIRWVYCVFSVRKRLRLSREMDECKPLPGRHLPDHPLGVLHLGEILTVESGIIACHIRDQRGFKVRADDIADNLV
jgi:hypothetical protein